jgi:hypothetical protein
MYTGIVTQTADGRLCHKIMFDGVLLLPMGTGYISWGHLGQSAYDAALTILSHAFGSRKKALTLSHRFKREVISELYIDCSWDISIEEIMKWERGGKVDFTTKSCGNSVFA